MTLVEENQVPLKGTEIWGKNLGIRSDIDAPSFSLTNQLTTLILFNWRFQIDHSLNFNLTNLQVL